MELQKNGDAAIFEEIYTTYFPLLYNYAFTIVKNRAEAEDAVGDVFLKLWEEKHLRNIETSVKSYLFKSVYNQCINILQREEVREKYANYVQHLQYVNENDSDYPLSSLIESELTETLQKAIEKLPPQCRKIFEMSRMEQMTHEEIARKLGVSINTVHMQIKRALGKLRIELKDFLEILLPLVIILRS